LAQITELLDKTLEAVRRIAAASNRGRAKSSRRTSTAIATEVAVMHLRHDSN
jgi:hypothetical protein